MINITIALFVIIFNSLTKDNVVATNSKHITTDKHVYSRLADVDMSGDDFKHNNMVPFFGGKMTQNVNFTNAFKIYRKSSLIKTFPLISESFNIFLEIPLKIISRNFSYRIIPISWKGRISGVSKF